MNMTIRRREMAVALGLVATLACSHTRADKPPARPVRVEKVQGEGVPGGLRYSATIQPHEQVQLAFKVGGYVREVQQRSGADGRARNLQQGDLVARGTVLARVNPADYQERVNQARAQVAEAEAGFGKARADAARAESLYQGKALTRPDYDAATANQAAALARAEGAKAQLETAQISLRDSALVAPTDGVVLSRTVEVGTLAGVGTVGFVLADLSSVKAVFGVPDRVVQQVHVGTSLMVTSDTFVGAQFPGKVTAVSPSADAQSRVFSVEVTIPNPDRRLKAGMIATVEVSSGAAPDIAPGSPTVSVAAVVKSSKAGAFAVFVAEGPDDEAIAHARDVSLGRISGNRVAVAAGLKLGDRVVVSGASLLTDGDRLRVIPGREGE
jgi:multidrug efflux system membrane fusion protein